jgi:glycosyltransferase involved in cell wall biosynthesis
VTFVYTRVPPGHLAERVDPNKLGQLPDVKLIRKGFHPFAVLGDAPRLRAFIGRESVDLVFCHQSHDHWLAWWTTRQMEDPPILARQVHESRQLQPAAATRWLFDRTDALLVAAQRWKQRLIDGCRLDPSRIFMLPPAVDLQRFSPHQPAQLIRDEIGAGPDDRLVGLVSRIKPGRGHAEALAAFQRLQAEAPNLRLLFVGRGEGREALEAVARAGRAAERVHFLGYRAEDLPAIYAALDVCLMLGEGSDGTCRAALEAQACGTPVVAFPVGALPEYMVDGETGLIVERDVDSLTAGIREALETPHLRERARGHAERQLSPARRVAAAERIFEELVNVRRTA